jgi:hypothetical protein
MDQTVSKTGPNVGAQFDFEGGDSLAGAPSCLKEDKVALPCRLDVFWKRMVFYKVQMVRVGIACRQAGLDGQILPVDPAIKTPPACPADSPPVVYPNA